MIYDYERLPKDAAFFLGGIRDLVDDNATIDFLIPEDSEVKKRKTHDGFFTFISQIEGKTVGVCFNDYRSYGSSFGVENSERVGAFLDDLRDRKIPLIYLANSAGVRVQDSRRVFKNSFTLVKKIKDFAKDNLYISACLGHSLGLSALLYSLGDYRLALRDVCKFNLTGPEVFRMFFGDQVSFDKACNAETMMYENQLVQELCDDQTELISRLRSLFANEKKQESKIENATMIDAWTQENSMEIFKGFGKSVKVYIKDTSKGKIGIFANPYNRPNMITVKDIKKMRFGLKFFAKLGLPIINLVDTAGGDPRIEENNNNIAGHLYDLASDLIDYPFYKRGIIIGRCFGGASMLTIPVFYGGDKTLLLEDAKLGIMDNKIIDTLLTPSKPLHDIWSENVKGEAEDYSDYIEQGLVEPIIKAQDFHTKILEGIQ